MMNFKRLIATVKETNESFTLYDGNNFTNFDRLHELLGKDYHNVNDDLMDGIVNGLEWTHIVYKDAEPVLHITFTYTPVEEA